MTLRLNSEHKKNFRGTAKTMLISSGEKAIVNDIFDKWNISMRCRIMACLFKNCFIYLFFLIVEQVFSIFSCKMSNVNKVADEIKMSFERPNDQEGGQNLFFHKDYKLDFAGVNPIAKPESESELQKTHTYLWIRWVQCHLYLLTEDAIIQLTMLTTCPSIKNIL